MSKNEFLDKLFKALSNDLNKNVVQENIDYYSQYIDNEIRKGRREEEVIAELGDPWAIAKTIADTEMMKGKKSNTYESVSSTYGDEGRSTKRNEEHKKNSFFDGLGGGIKVFLILLLIVAVIAIVVVVIGGIFSALVPIMIPVMILILLYRLLSNRR